jgi:hypothetical protein
MKYVVLSPDGISIEGISYQSLPDAKRALLRWARRFAWQGFYSACRWERIPLAELPGRCRIVAAPTHE